MVKEEQSSQGNCAKFWQTIVEGIRCHNVEAMNSGKLDIFTGTRLHSPTYCVTLPDDIPFLCSVYTVSQRSVIKLPISTVQRPQPGQNGGLPSAGMLNDV